MLKNVTVRDLAILTLAKLAIIAVIYFAFFAPYDGRPVDTAAHLLGPAAAAQSLNASSTKGF